MQPYRTGAPHVPEALTSYVRAGPRRPGQSTRSMRSARLGTAGRPPGVTAQPELWVTVDGPPVAAAPAPLPVPLPLPPLPLGDAAPPPEPPLDPPAPTAPFPPVAPALGGTSIDGGLCPVSCSMR